MYRLTLKFLTLRVNCDALTGAIFRGYVFRRLRTLTGACQRFFPQAAHPYGSLPAVNIVSPYGRMPLTRQFCFSLRVGIAYAAILFRSAGDFLFFGVFFCYNSCQLICCQIRMVEILSCATSPSTARACTCACARTCATAAVMVVASKYVSAGRLFLRRRPMEAAFRRLFEFRPMRTKAEGRSHKIHDRSVDGSRFRYKTTCIIVWIFAL